MVQNENFSYANAIADFLDYEITDGGQQILDILQQKYGLDPWKYKAFHTFKKGETLNFYFLTETNQIEAFQYDKSREALILLTDLTFEEVAEFIIDCSEEVARLTSAKKNGAIGLLAGALKPLLDLSSKDAANIIAQLPRIGSSNKKLVFAQSQRK